jgi:uncharacterized protein YndB with AHSA1/START domain
MNRAKHVFVSYIAVPPEKVWDALVDAETTKHYWGHRNESDWKPGSPWQMRRLDETNTVNIEGKVIEASQPKRLVISWANPGESEIPGKASRVAFDLDPYIGGNTKFVVTHDDLEPGSSAERGVISGWPLILSSLKSFVETGKTLPLLTAKERAATS